MCAALARYNQPTRTSALDAREIVPSLKFSFCFLPKLGIPQGACYPGRSVRPRCRQYLWRFWLGVPKPIRFCWKTATTFLEAEKGKEHFKTVFHNWLKSSVGLDLVDSSAGTTFKEELLLQGHSCWFRKCEGSWEWQNVIFDGAFSYLGFFS